MCDARWGKRRCESQTQPNLRLDGNAKRVDLRCHLAESLIPTPLESDGIWSPGEVHTDKLGSALGGRVHEGGWVGAAEEVLQEGRGRSDGYRFCGD